MAFWLAKARHAHAAGTVQRFDPLYWTVNFPRPMMASATTTASDAMRITCDFVTKGDLAGLIWESEDNWDHPLLAYKTDQNYEHTVLSFRWKSSGLIPLDAANGPTLTIEGKDAAGADKTWYVRLWNYAEGTPENAHIRLPFSSLDGGWSLPGERINPKAISRLFISLTPPGFTAGSAQVISPHQAATVDITDIKCEGDRALLSIGECVVPPHGSQIATGYDDAYNQTPARQIRSALALGYRGEILHYVGMSHFYRLVEGEGRLIAASDGSLCASAIAWHKSFLMQAKALGFEVILSLSFELLAQNCPDAWRQRAANGDAAATGWSPPSSLLSPANTAALAWLKAAAKNFAQLLVDAGLPLKFQVGEPWWWVMADGRPCIYDAAAKAALGGNPVAIPTLKTALNSAQTALLDSAGTILGNAAKAVANEAKSVSPTSAQTYILLFTPTVLDAAMPELKRLNMPTNWAYPAFNRLQLEDYDWLTAGAHGARRAAYDAVKTRLSYPISSQDYLSGFVLKAEDKEAQWPHIDAALDEARTRGVTRRFVWALPQIARDGYTHFKLEEEAEVQAFDDISYPLALGRDSSVSPEFSTSVSLTASGFERRNSQWADARLHYDVGPGVRSDDELGILIAFFRARRGAARGFRLRDPFDFSSNAMTKTPTMTDQVLGLGDGKRSSFPLVKNYGAGAALQTRSITRPVASSVVVSVAGQARTSGWSLSAGGVIDFTTAPASGQEVRAGFLFDVPVRFAQDRLDISGANFAAGEAPSVPLVEIREV